jgi:hypothetical protein
MPNNFYKQNGACTNVGKTPALVKATKETQDNAAIPGNYSFLSAFTLAE